MSTLPQPAAHGQRTWADPARDKSGPRPERWAIKVEFDGTDYVGWQKQKSGLAIQQLIEEAATQLSSGQPVPSITSGRTDSGVHAAGLVAHLDFPPGSNLTAHALAGALNYRLKPHPVVVLQAAPVSLSWNARFSATWRRYRYSILNRRARPALQARTMTHVPYPLDVSAMRAASQHLLGHHDFSSFRAAACQARDALRTLDELTIHQEGDVIFMETQARSFLHHQVRNMVGTLVQVGRGRWHPDDVKRILQARDRTQAGPTAPATGLCFMAVGYDEDPFAS
ncbi:tRNA pseudouridine(38-40) synthase TruA [Formicincola oecophyllae]|uniref:tRNA pseudouridine synthase A n=1 Tax=Formicincola oecophyllae TaxID=2558361 RepID=A0A4Y6UBE8_9PROT|nr:tRNA pseudouridine(38-40) synthase TruA [Formicincola oecophyllae]QDH13898.1 tRNA pseudouridine(38-40) synthase TruA [Formicincola oecophyllae]